VTARSGVALGALDIDSSMATAAQLAPRLEGLGYLRYWFTEHQPQASPVLPVALLLGLTESLRVGTGGILLGYHNVYRVAQDFRFLEEVYPGRVDAGFCGGHVAPSELPALREDGARPSHAEQEERATTLVALLQDAVPEDHPWRRARQITRGGACEPWLLGTSAHGAILAAKLGVHYAHSLFHRASDDNRDAMSEYRTRLGGTAERRSAIAVAGVCARTDDEASLLRAGYTETFFVPRIVGSVQRCADLLGEMIRRHAPEDVLFLDLCQELEPKQASYELFAEAARAAF